MGRRLLIIDDEENLRQSLQAFLGMKGYEVATTGKIKDDLDILHEFNPEILLLDLCLSNGVKGTDVLKKIRAFKPDLKVVILTGFGDEKSLEEECRKLGAVKFLSKPLTLDEIKAELDTIS